VYVLFLLSEIYTYLRSHQNKITFERKINDNLRAAELHLEHKVQERTALLKDSTITAENAKQVAEEQKLSAELTNKEKSAFLANMSHEFARP
jgi:signal transduction histidine kinase